MDKILFINLLLLCGDIEENPGKTQKYEILRFNKHEELGVACSYQTLCNFAYPWLDLRICIYFRIIRGRKCTFCIFINC